MIRSLVLVAAAWLVAGCASEPSYDLLLRGGTVVDGTGAPRARADVAIRGDRVAAVEPSLDPSDAARVVDVSGLVVAPGFWDNHAHLTTLEDQPTAENFLRQGITTIVASLHSQDQPYPMDAYRARVRMVPNVGLFAGHTWIRKRVMGLENRAPTEAELEEMRALVEEAMQQGALGLATGLEYVPAVFSDTDEIVALAEVAAGYGGIYVTHMRDEGVRVLESIEEALEVGRRAGLPVHVNHHKVTGATHWGLTEKTLALLDEAAAEGLEVAHDVYPYTAFSTYSDLMFPAWVLADGEEAFAARVADPPTRERLTREMLAIFTQQAGAGPESVQFRTLDAMPEMQGRTLADYLEAQGRPATLEEAVEALIELQLQGSFIGIFHGMDESDVERILRHPSAMIETDGDLVTPGTGYPHPRSYGAFPRVLARYVRELGVLSLEEAVHKMTALPATWLEHTDRGTLRPGQFADVTVFDADTVRDVADYTDPHHYSEGIVHVIVNGEMVLEDGAVTGALPGRFLERRRGR